MMQPDDNIIKLFLPIYFVLYLSIAFVFPTYRTYRNTGINPLTFGKSDNAHDYIGRLFKLIFALLPVEIALYLISDDLYGYLLPATYLELPALKIAGILLCLVSLVWTW